MKRSKRIEALDKRPVNLDGFINEWPEMGFAAMSSPYDPKPSVKVVDGKIVEEGGYELVEKVDTEGYEWVFNKYGITPHKEEKKKPIVLEVCGASGAK